MTRAKRLDVDDVTRCPLAATCRSCDCSSEDLAVWTVTTPVGVYCVTLCGMCFGFGELGQPPGSWTAAIEAVHTHCEHLDCDVDEMAAVLAAEEAT